MTFNQPLSIDWTQAPAGGTLHARVLDLSTDTWQGAAVNAQLSSLGGNNYKATVVLDTAWGPGVKIVWYADSLADSVTVDAEPYIAAKRSETGGSGGGAAPNITSESTEVRAQ